MLVPSWAAAQAAGPKPSAVEAKAEAVEGQSRVIDLTVKDPGNGPIQFQVGDPKNGKVSNKPAAAVAVKDLPYKLIYTPSAKFTGVDEFTYKVRAADADPWSEAKITVNVAGAADAESKFVATVQANAGQYDPDNLKRNVLCRLLVEGDGPNRKQRYECDEGAIEVSALEQSTVRVELPKGIEKVCVTAGERWSIPDLNQDCVDYSVSECRPPAVLQVDLYRERLLNPAYAGGQNRNPAGNGADGVPSPMRHVRRAHYYLRGAEGPCDASCCAENLSLLLSGKAGPLKIDLWGTEPGGGARYAQSLTVDLLFYRFLLDVAGFYALRHSGDEELVTRDRVLVQQGEDPVPQKEIVRLDAPSETSSSGIMLTFFHRNYPSAGLSLGFAYPEDRSPTYLLGLSWRILSLGPSAMATFTAGYAWAHQRSYPGIEEGMTFDATDPRLTGDLDYEAEPFVGVALGFALPSRPSKK
jgi:hypothetical protein